MNPNQILLKAGTARSSQMNQIMNRKTTIMALMGIFVFGAAATAGFKIYGRVQDSYRQVQASQIFQQRVHCKAVADAYVKEKTDLKNDGVTGTSAALDKVDYSPARNSCVAELETTFYFKGGASSFDSVQDLLSGETLFSVNITDDYGEALQPRFFPRVWDYVMNNASEPVELEKEWALTESKNPPKATSPASAVAEPNDRQTLPATEYDAQGKPTASPQQKIYFDPMTGEALRAHPSQHKSPPPSSP